MEIIYKVLNAIPVCSFNIYSLYIPRFTPNSKNDTQQLIIYHYLETLKM